jgi:hypothetical protein
MVELSDRLPSDRANDADSFPLCDPQVHERVHSNGHKRVHRVVVRDSCGQIDKNDAQQRPEKVPSELSICSIRILKPIRLLYYLRIKGTRFVRQTNRTARVFHEITSFEIFLKHFVNQRQLCNSFEF